MFVIVNGDDDELNATTCCKVQTIKTTVDNDRKNVMITLVILEVCNNVLEVYMSLR